MADESTDDVASLEQHCRALINAFAYSDYPDEPTDDPLVVQLADEIGSFPEPSFVIQMLAAMVVSASRRLNRFEREHGRLERTLPEIEVDFWTGAPVGGQRLLIHQCFEVVHLMARPVRDVAALADGLGVLTYAHGARAAICLSHLYLTIAQMMQDVDGAMTLEVVLRTWALADEVALIEDEQD